MPKTPVGARLSMACPFCGDPAHVKACRTGGLRSTPGQDWFWRCACGARGFFPDSHFRELDKRKKISTSS